MSEPSQKHPWSEHLANVHLLRQQLDAEAAEPYDEDRGVGETVECKFCHQEAPASTAHLHDGQWVGDDCCWDERLRATE